MEVAAAVAIYFSIVFGTGFLVGPIRVLFVEPRVGALAAVLLEAPILLLAMILTARFAVRWTGVARSSATLIAVGVAALLVQQVADVAVAILMRGMTSGDYFEQFTTAPGMIYAALLTAFVLVPWATQKE